MVASGSDCSLILAPQQHSSSAVLNNSRNSIWIHFRVELITHKAHRLHTSSRFCELPLVTVFSCSLSTHYLGSDLCTFLSRAVFHQLCEVPSFTLLWLPSKFKHAHISSISCLHPLPPLVNQSYTPLIKALWLPTHYSAETILAKVTFAMFVAKFIGYIQSLTR